MKAAGYCRVSSKDQTNGTSLDAQKAAITAYAAMKGLELVGIFSDEAISGGKPLSERPEGAELCGLIDKGEINCVVVTKLDRGFRNVVDCLSTVDQWHAVNVGLHIIDLGGSSVDTQSPMGRFMLTVLAAAAEMEKGMIRDRCNVGRRARKAEGKRIGEIPYGYVLGEDGKTLIEDPEEQRALEISHEMRERGASLRQISDELNRREIKAKKGGKWTHGQVQSVLKRAA